MKTLECEVFQRKLDLVEYNEVSALKQGGGSASQASPYLKVCLFKVRCGWVLPESGYLKPATARPCLRATRPRGRSRHHSAASRP